VTGAYIRIQRDGRWQAVEFDRLSDAELEAWATANPEEGWRWAKFLAKWIRENVVNVDGV